MTEMVDRQDRQAEKDRVLYHWKITEDIQDAMPYLEWGWFGFVPMIIYRS
jgi:hypothetical protein